MRITRAALLLLAVANPAAARPQEKKVTYQDQVLPLFRNHCLSCHDAEKKKGDLDLSSYSSLLAGGSGGEVAKAGAAVDSPLFKVVAHLADPKMPPKKARLPDVEVDLIRAWIDGGLLESSGSVARRSAKPKVDLSAAVSPGGAGQAVAALPEHLALEPVLRTARAEAVTALAAAPGAPLFAVAAPRQVLLYRTDTLDLAGVLPFPERHARVLRFSRNGALLVAGGGRGAHLGKVVGWDVRTGARVFEAGDELDAVLAADLSADHRRVALGGPGKLVKIYSVPDGELLHSIKKHTDWVTALEFSPDGVLLATGDRSGGLHVWEARSGRIFMSLAGHKGAVTGLSWRGELLASGSEDGQVMIWEMENGSRARAWKAHDAVTSLAWGRDGRIVTCGRDRVTRLWAADGKKERDFEAFSDVALQTVLSHDGAYVVAGDWTGEVRVWASADGKRAATLGTNPPTLAMRLEADLKAVDTARGSAKSAEGRVSEAGQAARAAAGAQKQADAASTASAEALKGAEAAIARSDAGVAAAAAAEKQAREMLSVREAEAAREAEEARKAREGADKAKEVLAKAQEAAVRALQELENDPAKAKALEGLQRAAADRAGEFAAATEAAQKAAQEAVASASAMEPARKAAAEAKAGGKKAADERAAAAVLLESSRKTQADATLAALAARKAAETAAAREAAERKALETAQAEIALLEGRIAGWKAGQFNLQVHARRTEIAGIQAEYDALTAAAADLKEAGALATREAGAAADADAAAIENVKALEAALAQAQAGPAKASAVHEAAQKSVLAKEARAAAARPLADELSKAASESPALAEAAQKAGEAIGLINRDIVEAKGAMEARAKDIEAARAAIPVAEQKLADGRRARETAAKRSAERAAAAKDAAARVAPGEARAAAFKPTLDAARAELEKLHQAYLKLLPSRT